MQVTSPYLPMSMSLMANHMNLEIVSTFSAVMTGLMEENIAKTTTLAGLHPLLTCLHGGMMV